MKKISKAEAELIMETLLGCYPDAGPELDFTNAFELLIAVILSAQCTDKRVNLVTEVLFKQLTQPSDIYEIPLLTLEGIIKTCGLYHAKAKHIDGTCRALAEKYDNEIPSTREALMTLPGVGRKTANVVISNAFATPAIAVDTHVMRLSNRIGFSSQKTPDHIEQDLMKLLRKDRWTLYHHILIFHGRRVCHARKPACESCAIHANCRYTQKEGR